MELDKYQQVKPGTTFSFLDGAGILHISGADRLNFVQRQTTNDINLLKADRVIKTVLTSPTARILDVWLVFTIENEQTLAVLPLPGRVMRTERFLQSRIFFNDKVSVKQAEETNIHIELDGPDSAVKLRAAGLVEESIPQPGEIRSLTFAGLPALLLREILPNTKYRLILPADGKSQAVRSLENSGFIAINSAERELLRIESGLAGEKNELTEDYTPLETGLVEFISGSKGCYTGQEIIARQITYDKITRRLVGLRLQAAVQTGNPVLANGQAAGAITSAVISPSFGAIALAVLKRPFFEAGTEISVQAESEKISGQVSALPFQ